MGGLLSWVKSCLLYWLIRHTVGKRTDAAIEQLVINALEGRRMQTVFDEWKWRIRTSFAAKHHIGKR